LLSPPTVMHPELAHVAECHGRAGWVHSIAAQSSARGAANPMYSKLEID
jgi:hypothetical protein